MALTTVTWDHPVTDKMKSSLERHGCRLMTHESDQPWHIITLPDGWTLQIPDTELSDRSSTYYHFVDSRGCARVEAFVMHSRRGDRTEASPLPRYQFSCTESEHGVARGVATDGARIIYTSDPFKAKSPTDTGHHLTALAAVTTWLDNHYPDHRDPWAYWP